MNACTTAPGLHTETDESGRHSTAAALLFSAVFRRTPSTPQAGTAAVLGAPGGESQAPCLDHERGPGPHHLPGSAWAPGQAVPRGLPRRRSRVHGQDPHADAGGGPALLPRPVNCSSAPSKQDCAFPTITPVLLLSFSHPFGNYCYSTTKTNTKRKYLSLFKR